MVGVTRDVRFNLLGNSKSAVKAFGEVEQAGGKLAGGFGKLASAAVAVGGAVGFASLAKSAFNLGSELTGMATKSSAVFGDSLGDVQAWAKTVNKTFGLSSNEVVGLAANMGDLLKPMGFTSDQAAQMAQDTVGLAGALSEWSNGTVSAAEVSDVLSKAMLGETDGLKALGIAISAAEVGERALALAKADGRDEITQTDKALATSQLIFEKSTDAQDAYAAGGNKLLRAQNKLKATLLDLRDRIVMKLVPAFLWAIDAGERFAKWASESQWLADLRDRMADVAERVVFVAVAFVRFAVQAKDRVAGFVDWFNGSAAPAIIGGAKRFADWIVDEALPRIVKFVDTVRDSMGRFVDWFRGSAVPAIIGNARRFVEWFITHVPPAFRTVVDTVRSAFGTVSDVVAVASEWLIAKGREFLDWYDKHVAPAMDNIVKVVKAAFIAVAAVIAVFVIAGIELWQRFGDSIMKYVGFLFDFVISTVGNALQIVKEIIEVVLAVIAGDWGEVWQSLGEIVKRLFDVVKDTAKLAMEGLKLLVDEGLRLLADGWALAWDGIAAVAAGVWEGIKTVAKGGVNVVIGYINTLIGAWNSLDFTFGGVDLGPFGSVPAVTLGLPDIPRIPKLASGSVAAPNRPFLAMLGDNTREHEVVSPVSTMREAFRAELAAGAGAGGTFVIQLGDTVLDRVVVDSLGRIKRTRGKLIGV